MALERCNHCSQESKAGHKGDADTEWAGLWFCSDCWSSWSKEHPVPKEKQQRACTACQVESAEGRCGDPHTEWSDSWFCTTCWRSWSKDHGNARPCDQCGKFPTWRPGSYHGRSFLCGECSSALLDPRVASQTPRPERVITAVATHSTCKPMLPKPVQMPAKVHPRHVPKVKVVFWGICDLKYDSRSDEGSRVKVLEVGDGRSSRFSGHGEHIKETFHSTCCLSASPINCAVMTDNKKIQHDLFVHSGFAHLRPRQCWYRREYHQWLADKIVSDLELPQDGAVMLKLVNRQRGAGIVACRIVDLDHYLQVLLRPPQGAEQEQWFVRNASNPNASVQSLGELDPLDEQKRHYWASECPFFVAEEVCHSEPATKPEGSEAFDGTMRVGFALRRTVVGHDDLEVEWLGGYWKLPPKSLSEEAQTSQDVQHQLVSSFNTFEKRTAEVSQAQLKEVYEQLGPALKVVFDPSGFSEKSLERTYSREPLLHAFALTRLAARTCISQSKSKELLQMAKDKALLADSSAVFSSAAEGGSIPVRSLLSYVERVYGVHHTSTGQFEEGLERHKQATKLHPFNSASYFLQGISYQAEEMYDVAAECFLMACCLDPDFRAGFNALGVCLYHLGNIQEAIEAFNACLRRQSDCPHALYNKAQSIYRLLYQSYTTLEDCSGRALEEWKADDMRQKGAAALQAAKKHKPSDKAWTFLDKEMMKYLQGEVDFTSHWWQPCRVWMWYTWRRGG